MLKSIKAFKSDTVCFANLKMSNYRRSLLTNKDILDIIILLDKEEINGNKDYYK